MGVGLNEVAAVSGCRILVEGTLLHAVKTKTANKPKTLNFLAMRHPFQITDLPISKQPACQQEKITQYIVFIELSCNALTLAAKPKNSGGKYCRPNVIST